MNLLFTIIYRLGLVIYVKLTSLIMSKGQCLSSSELRIE